MKNLLNLFVAVCFVIQAQAQFAHTFTSSTSFYPSIDNGGVLNAPGCFRHYGSYSQLYWDNTTGGVKAYPNGNLYLVFLPLMNIQSGYSVKITYSSPNALDVRLNFAYGPGAYAGGHTLTNLPAAATPTEVTLNVSGFSGMLRPYIYTTSNSPTIVGNFTLHAVEVTNAIYSPGSGCTVTNQFNACTDTDSDGVCDNDDDYPNDATKAYSSNVPATTFMYEDLYPYYGDFDFNDLVVNSVREVITDADNTLRYLVIDAQVKASGASIAQGWGLELNGISPSDVVSVNGNSTESNVMSLGANGTENGQTNAVIPIFDNVNKVINRAGGAFFNTVSADPQGSGETVQVVIEFAKSSNLSIGDLDYNFFSFKTSDRGHEIHEIGNTPTDLANLALFGTGADATDLNGGETYVSVDGFPWAMSTSGTAYAIEKVDIVEAFLKFAAWAQSGGTQYQDWHTNTSEGTYRNSAKIY